MKKFIKTRLTQSVKKSVKSGLNLVSKQVFKAFLLMSMMLLSWNGWGQDEVYLDEGMVVGDCSNPQSANVSNAEFSFRWKW